MFSFIKTPFRSEIRRFSAEKPFTYKELDQRQRDLALDIAQGSAPVLLLSELSPVITYGKRTPPQDLLFSKAHFDQLGIELYPTDRGGLATYHGPGQWVAFPVARLLDLTGDTRGVRKAVDLLLQVMLDVCQAYRPDAEIREGSELGIWATGGKLASLGVHFQDGVLLHGFAVNVIRTPLSFQGIRPCGKDAPLDFLLPPGKDTEGNFIEVGKKIVQSFS